LKLKFQTVAEKTAKNFRGLLYFAAPGRGLTVLRPVITDNDDDDDDDHRTCSVTMSGRY